MDVHTLSAPQRRMLLEMLVSERAGESALHVGDYFDRDRTANSLCHMRMARWVAEQGLVFTTIGRLLAKRLAVRLVDRGGYVEQAS